MHGNEEYQYWLDNCPKCTRDEFPEEIANEINRQLKNERRSRLYELRKEREEIEKTMLFMDDIGKFVFTEFFLKPIEREEKHLRGKINHRNTNKIDIEEIKRVPIVRVLSTLGIKTYRSSSTRLFFKLRNEKTASACAFTDTNKWYDFGNCKGGSVIDLVMEYNNFTIKESINFLSNIAT